jgi:hypothetical protein
MNKPIICIDFDGVIHSYEHGWRNGEIYGTVTNGFFEWASVMKDHFTLVIYSSRSKDINMQAKMYLWLMDRWHDWIASHSPIGDFIVYGDFEFAHQKPSAFITIDDRCICFNGDWSAITADRIFSFKPWNKS